VGNDADLVLLSLASGVRDITLFGDALTGRDSVGCFFDINSVFKDLQRMEDEDRGEKKKEIGSEEEKGRRPNRVSEHVSRLAMDLVVLSLLQGNDYMPKLRGVNMRRMWKEYRRVRREREKKNINQDHNNNKKKEEEGKKNPYSSLSPYLYTGPFTQSASDAYYPHPSVSSDPKTRRRKEMKVSSWLNWGMLREVLKTSATYGLSALDPSLLQSLQVAEG